MLTIVDNSEVKEGTVLASGRHVRLDVARVTALVDPLQRREVQVTVERDKSTLVFFDKVGELVPDPVVCQL
jgi:hypothetical protein